MCDMSSAATTLPFPGTSLPPVLDLACQHAEGNGNRVLFLVNNTVNKTETPEAPSEKPPCVSFPAVEVAKTQDYHRPQPIPEGKNGKFPVCTSEICWTKGINCPSDSTGIHGVMTVSQSYNFSTWLKLSNYVTIVFLKSVLCVLAEMLCGWWRVSDMEELHSLVKALHSRGIREKVLQKQFQKHMEYMTQLCANSKDGVFTSPLLSFKSGFNRHAEL